MTHYISRPDFAGCGFRAHAAATTATLFFFSCRGRVYYWRPLTYLFACIGVEFRIQWLLVGIGLEGFCGLWRTTGLAGSRTHHIGFGVIVVVVFPRLRIISSHLVLYQFHLSVLISSGSLFLVGYFNECKTGSVERQHCGFALEGRSPQNRIHICSTTPSLYFLISPF